MGAKDIVFDILAVDRASKVLDSVGDKASKLGAGFGKLGQAAAYGAGVAATAGLAALSAAMVGGVKDAVAYQTLSAKTAQVIASTGNAAKVSVKGLQDYAGQLESMSGIDEETILNGENVLLTFTNVQNRVGKGNDIFNQATLAATNMSAALGQDMQSSVIQLGKALNDPIKGVTALSKVGVSFTAEQKAQIKTLVASGKTMDAQKVILGELNKEFGGAAEAAGSGFAGSLARAQDAVGDAFRAVGTLLLPVITKLADAFADNVGPAIQSTVAFIGNIADSFQYLFGQATNANDFADYIDNIFGGGGRLVSGARVVGQVIRELVFGVRAFFLSLKDGDVTSDGFVGVMETIGSTIHDQVLPAIGQILPVVLSVGQTLVTTLAPVVMQVASLFANQIIPAVVRFAQTLIANVVPVVLAFVQVLIANVVPVAIKLGQVFFGTVVPAILGLVPVFTRIVGVITTSVIPILGQIASFIVGQVVPAIVAIVIAVAQRLKPVFDALVPAVEALLAKFRECLPTIEKVISVVLKVTGFILELAAAILGKVLPPLIRFTTFLLVNVVGAVVAVIGVVIAIIGKIVDFGGAVVAAVGKVGEFASGVGQKVGEVLGFFTDLPGKILGVFGKAGSLLLGVGKDIVRGLINGIGSMARSVIDALLDLIPGPLKKFAGALGIQSPSKVFRGFGVNVGQGFALGIDSTQSQVSQSVRALASTALGAPVSGLSPAAGRYDTALPAARSSRAAGLVELGDDTVARLARALHTNSLTMARQGAV